MSPLKANIPLRKADGLAQLVEQRPFKAWVLGSSPRPVTKLQEIGAFFIPLSQKSSNLPLLSTSIWLTLDHHDPKMLYQCYTTMLYRNTNLYNPNNRILGIFPYGCQLIIQYT